MTASSGTAAGVPGTDCGLSRRPCAEGLRHLCGDLLWQSEPGRHPIRNTAPAMPLAGWLTDKRGARAVVPTGAAAGALGTLAYTRGSLDALLAPRGHPARPRPGHRQHAHALHGGGVRRAFPVPDAC